MRYQINLDPESLSDSELIKEVVLAHHGHTEHIDRPSNPALNPIDPELLFKLGRANAMRSNLKSKNREELLEAYRQGLINLLVELRFPDYETPPAIIATAEDLERLQAKDRLKSKDDSDAEWHKASIQGCSIDQLIEAYKEFVDRPANESQSTVDPGQGHAEPNPEEDKPHVPKLERQKATIIKWLKDNDHDPLNLPADETGKAGVKSEARKELVGETNIRMTNKNLKDAWQSLRNDKQIIQPPPI